MLKQSRLDALADGVFAIVMTLLVIEIRVPEIEGFPGSAELWHALGELLPLVISYVLSFLLLFTYWRGHHYIASVLAKNVDNRLASINAVFLLFVALVPFTTHFLGSYEYSFTAIAVYAINIIIIGSALLWMRLYIKNAKTVRNKRVTRQEERNGLVRILLPVLMAVLALLAGLVDTNISLILFGVTIIFNLSSRSTKLLNGFFNILPIAIISKSKKLPKKETLAP